MLTKEQNYDFRKAMLQVHKKDLRDELIIPESDDFEITNGMSIVMPEDATEVIRTAVMDFADYLYTSMGVSVLLKTGVPEDGEIYVATKDQIFCDLEGANSYKGFKVIVDDRITVCGFDDRGAAQGLYFLEDEMTERRAPFLSKKNHLQKTSVFTKNGPFRLRSRRLSG